jgi:hypothetical protein
MASPEELQEGLAAAEYFQSLGYSHSHVTLITAWCVAELAWKFTEHAHQGGGPYQQTFRAWGIPDRVGACAPALEVIAN